LRIVHVSPEAPREDRLEAAKDVLDRGGVIALPTETFYGLAASAFDADALARVNRLKGKSEDSPVLLLLADTAQASRVASNLSDRFYSLAERFWPGPLTLLVPASAELPPEVSGGRGTVALRVPGLVLPRRLAARLGHPFSGVSANRTGDPPGRNAADVVRAFPEGLEMVLDGGASRGGAPSTILDLTVDSPRIVRKGLLPASALEPFLGDPEG